MPLADIVTIEVGSAVVKAILQIWLKDPYAMADFSVNLLDIFKSKTSDRIAQHKAQRQFEAIGERIGESLVPLFESEGTRLDESERIEVAEVIAETFKKARISTTLLVKENLEPTKLAHHVQAAHPIATNHLNEAQTTLYHRIIRESCEYIVDIASQLPAFTEQSFGEILKREDRLLTVA